MLKKIIFAQILLTSGMVIADVESLDFKKESNEFNKTLPMMIDEETQLDGTMFINNTFIYKNTLVNYKKGEISATELKNKMETLIVNYVCTTPEMKTFTNNGVSVNYRYYGNKGAYITGITVSPEKCESVNSPKDGVGVKERELVESIPVTDKD